MQRRLIVALVTTGVLAMPATATAQAAWKMSSITSRNHFSSAASPHLIDGMQRAPISSLGVDSLRPRSRRGAIIGGVLGAVLGGTAAAAYVLNATSYHCVTIGPPCPNDHHTTRRVTTIALSSATGAFLGVWLGHRLSATRPH